MTTHLITPLLAHIPSSAHAALHAALRSDHHLRSAWDRGNHPARTRGDGTDFHEHRLYQPGDDLRRIDWRAAARADRTVLRETEREVLAPVLVVLDSGGGMAYGAQANEEREGLGKWTHAKAIAAALWLMARQHGDPIGGLLSGHQPLVSAWEKPSLRNDRVIALAQTLSAVKPAHACQWTALFERLANLDLTNTTIFLIGDFLDLRGDAQDDPDARDQWFNQQIARLIARARGIQIVQVLHRDDLTFPFSSGLRGEATLELTDPRSLIAAKIGAAEHMREPYLAAITQHLAWQHTTWTAQGVVHHRHVTDEALAHLLPNLAAKRSATATEAASSHPLHAGGR